MQLDAVAERRMTRVRSTHYGRDEGLPSLQASFDVAPGAIRSGDGRLWIPMRTALAVVNPNQLRENPRPPLVLLKQILMDERTIAAYGGVMPVAKFINLPTSGSLRIMPRHHRLEFEFTALNFSAAREHSLSLSSGGF